MSKETTQGSPREYPCKSHPYKEFGAQVTTVDPVRSTDNPRIQDRLDAVPGKVPTK